MRQTIGLETRSRHDSKMTPILQTIDLRMTYHVGKMDVHALRGLSLDVDRGEFLAIMGPSGCGKSTLLHLCGGLLTPTEGKVLVDGEEITASSDARRTDVRRRKIGFVFQKFNLFPTLTAEGNLKLAERIFGKGSGDPERRRKVFELLKLEAKMRHKPLELSGGEQQRVAIARALVNEPALILADEPTGNLDSENSEVVLSMLRDLNKQTKQTIVMITHNPEAAQYADRIIHMRDGHVVKEERPSAPPVSPALEGVHP